MAASRAGSFFRISGRTAAIKIKTIAKVQTIVAPVGKSISSER
jgi:hypothetical protein